jgi:hypothetical protein
MRKMATGWHVGEMGEVEIFTKEADGRQSLMFRVKDTSGGDDDGLQQTIFAAYPADGKNYGEQKVADILYALDLEESFNKKYPESKYPSFFVESIIGDFQKKLPGMPCQFFVKEDKKGYTNVEKLVGPKVDTSKLGGGKAKDEDKGSGDGKSGNGGWD